MWGESHTHKHIFFLAFNLSCFSKEHLNSSALPIFLTYEVVAIAMLPGLKIPPEWTWLRHLYPTPPPNSTACCLLLGFLASWVFTRQNLLGTSDIILYSMIFMDTWALRSEGDKRWLLCNADRFREKQLLVNKSWISKTRTNSLVHSCDRRCSAWLMWSKFCKISFQFWLEL